MVRTIVAFTVAALLGGGTASADTQRRLPTGIYYTGNWTSSTGNPNTWQDVDDPVGSPDDGASYLYRRDSAALHALTYPAFSITASSIARVYLTVRCMRTAAGAVDMRPELKVNGVTYSAAAQPVTTSWVDYIFEWRVNPNTGLAWTESDVEGTGPNPLQRFHLWVAGLSAGEEVRCTQIYISVDYTVPGDTTAPEAVEGRWDTLAYVMPINPIHLALMHDGSVLNAIGSGNDETEFDYKASVWNDAGITVMPVGWDMFCNGMAALADGRIFIAGGNLTYDPFRGLKRTAIYDPVSRTFTDMEDMAHGRWYPTPLVLGDGRIMTFGGLDENAVTNTSVEFYTVGSGWSREYPAGWTPPLYPRLHLLPNGKVFYSGWSRESRFFDPATATWSSIIATTNYSGTRRYGTAVLLPLTPANGYKPRVMIMGGGDPGTATTELIDLSQPTPQWQYGPAMSQPRMQLNSTILPNGKVLVVGGSRVDLDATTASLNADLYDPATNTFSAAGMNAFPRLYHSASLLRPDGTVALVGGNPARRNFEERIEIYSPAYLFKSDGTPATRPVITGVPSGPIGYGTAFQVQTPDSANIASVVLMRLGAPTHAFDVEQRLVGLSYTVGSGVLGVTAPTNANIAPPGFYMLFILSAAGVPSVAKFVRLSAESVPANQPPTATITSPSTNVAVAAGGTVSFSGTGSDTDGTIASYGWTFTGGTPGSSTAASPGNITYSTAGTYTASFKVTDDDGAFSPTVTRTVTVTAPTTTQTQSRVPNGIYYTGNWVSSTNNANSWQDVADPVGSPDDNGSYLYRRDTAALHALTYTPFAITSSAIKRVYLTARCMRTATGTVDMRPELKVAGVTYTPPSQPVTTAWTNLVFEWKTNPATGAPWTEADVEGRGVSPLQRFHLWPGGVGTGEEVRCTQIFISVDYTP